MDEELRQFIARVDRFMAEFGRTGKEDPRVIDERLARMRLEICQFAVSITSGAAQVLGLMEHTSTDEVALREEIDKLSRRVSALEQRNRAA